MARESTGALHAIGLAAGMLSLGAALSTLLGVDGGTKGAALGVCAGTLASLVAGLALARLTSARFSSLLVGSALVAVLSGLAFAAGLPIAGRTLLLTHASAVGPIVMGGLGFWMGRGLGSRWVRLCLGGAILTIALSALGATLLSTWVQDLEFVVLGTILSVLGALVVVGAGIAVVGRRLALAECAFVALLLAYGLYIYAASADDVFLRAISLPVEQVMVALAFAPFLVGLAVLGVGASLGFLLTGSGRFDPGFQFEISIAKRYLRAAASARDVSRTFLNFIIIVVTLVLVPLWPLLLSSRVRKRWLIGGGHAVGNILVISVAGVSLGVTALVVVLSVMSGFEKDLQDKILGAHAHAVINKKGDDFTEYAEVAGAVAQVDGVRSAAAFVLGEGLISSGTGPAGVLVKGIDQRDADAWRELIDNIRVGRFEYLERPDKIPGRRWPLAGGTDGAKVRAPKQARVRPLPGIIVGQELARSLRIYLGDTVSLISPVSDEIGPNGPQPKLRRFRVAALFYSGMYEYDAKFAYVDLKRAQRFFGLRNRATGVEMRLFDAGDVDRVRADVRRRIGGHPYEMTDWRQMNKELFSALVLEKLAMFIILAFIVLVASFNIVSTLVMIVLEKGREIAILKSMGASDASIMKIFVIQGLIVGVGGALLGVFIGVSICMLLDTFGFSLDPTNFYIDRLPVVIESGEIALIAVSAVVITYLATIYPAMAAAQLSPVEGLRDG